MRKSEKNPKKYSGWFSIEFSAKGIVYGLLIGGIVVGLYESMTAVPDIRETFDNDWAFRLESFIWGVVVGAIYGAILGLVVGFFTGVSRNVVVGMLWGLFLISLEFVWEFVHGKTPGIVNAIVLIVIILFMGILIHFDGNLKIKKG